MIYGTTGAGGNNNDGVIFSYNPISHQQKVLFSFNGTNGLGPEGRMLYASDSLLYGYTGKGGTYNMGTVYSFNPRTKTESVVINFDSANGYQAVANGNNELIQGKDGLLYGTSWAGGKYGKGVLFSYDIHTHKDSIRCNFNDSTSQGPYQGPYMELWQDTTNGLLYGATEGGGYPGHGGVIYSFNPVNKHLIRYFVGTMNSSGPWAFSSGLSLANNGVLYGMSQAGGIDNDSGTIYSFNIHSGIVQEVFKFTGKGDKPNTNELLQLSNGLFYGGTIIGNQINGRGCLFSFNPVNKTEKILVTYTGANGSNPVGRLIQDPDNGFIYGVTYLGGDSGSGVLFNYDTVTSTYSKLLDFTGANGVAPLAGLTLVKDTSVHVIHTAVSEVKNESGEVKVYPNPSGGIFQLEITNYKLENNNAIEVYNVLGEKVYSQYQVIKLLNYQIDLSSQPNGIYFYRITTQSGELIGEGKMIIQR